jgi:hypothetical protein
MGEENRVSKNRAFEAEGIAVFYPCGASPYRTLKLELERDIMIMIMMGITPTPSDAPRG